MMMLSSGWVSVDEKENVTREMANEQTNELGLIRCARSKSAPCKLIMTERESERPGKARCQEMCPLCCEYFDEDDIYTNEEHAGSFMSACHCYACFNCITKWVTIQLPSCRANKTLRIQCYACHKTMPQKVVLLCEAAVALATALERREVLQRNDLFPTCMQVECRRAECVGIGYLGHETIMCMLCEEQWDALEDTVTHAGVNEINASELAGLTNGKLVKIKVGDTLTITVRKCPKCGVITEKNGGCDHMRCATCKHDYYWSTGQKFGLV